MRCPPPLARSLLMIAQMRVWFLALLMVWALSHASVRGGAGEPLAQEPTPAEKIRKVLDQPMTLDYSGVSLHEIARHLKERTRVNGVLDMVAIQQMGLGADENNMAPLTVNLKSDSYGKLRIAVQRMLRA